MSSKSQAAGAKQRGLLHTPDGRYIVVRGRLWRASDPNLPEQQREQLVFRLMAARRLLRSEADAAERAAARAEVQAAKVALGERGPVWWADGAPDLNRKMAANSPYAEWFAEALRTPGGLDQARVQQAAAMSIVRPQQGGVGIAASNNLERPVEKPSRSQP
jgi:hypothetical protein